MADIDMFKTQHELLKHLCVLGRDVVRLTSLLNVEDDSHAVLLEKREKVLGEITALRSTQKSLPVGGDIEALEEEFNSLILSAMSDSALLMEEVKTVRDTLKKELSPSLKGMRAAFQYQSYSRPSKGV